MHGTDKPDTWIDISETIDVKIAALKQHVSQLGDWSPDEEMRKWAEEEGKEKGMAFAEAYKVMINVEEKPEN